MFPYIGIAIAITFKHFSCFYILRMVYYLDEIKDIKPFTQVPKYISEAYIAFLLKQDMFLMQIFQNI